MAVVSLLGRIAHAASWSGVLRDGLGHPIPQCTVALRHEPQFVLETVTNAEGQFRFDNVAMAFASHSRILQLSGKIVF